MVERVRELSQLRAEYYKLQNKLADSQITNQSSIRWDRVTAIASLIVAALALAVSVWQGQVTRNHNRLSVKPQVQISRNLSLGADPKGLLVVNNGVGPATVHGSLLNFGGKDIGPIIRSTWGQIEGETKPPGTLTIGLFPKETYLSAGGRYDLLTLTEKNENETEAFRDLSNLLELTICYCSIYDECWTATWKFDAVSNDPIETCTDNQSDAS